MTLVILSEPKLYTAFFIKIGIVFNSEFISYNKIVSSDNKCANSSFILSLFFSAISFNFFCKSSPISFFIADILYSTPLLCNKTNLNLNKNVLRSPYMNKINWYFSLFFFRQS